MRQYFFDVSGVLGYLRHGSHFTGIQRVVVTLADAACRKLPDQAFISYLDRRRGTYVAVPYATLDPYCLTDPDAMRAAFGIRPLRQRREDQVLQKKYAGRPLRAGYHTMRRRLYAMIGRERYQHNFSLFPKQPDPLQTKKTRALEQIEFDTVAKAGDHLVVMDAVWGMRDVIKIFIANKKRGILVHTMLHDLIPVVAPHFTNNGILRQFEPWLRGSHEYTSSYLAVSHSTGRDLSEFLARTDISLPVRVTPLAQAPLPRAYRSSVTVTDRAVSVGFDVSVLSDSDLASERVRAILAYPYVLCVGTLEIRKNIWRIAQVWQRLSELEGILLPKLVFAGQPGWMVQDFERMMQATGHVSGWIEIVERPSDVELATMYKHCQFTIMASYYEGWGLPIGESLAYGKTAVVSKTSSMPEVGGELVEYCDPQSIDSIFHACRKLIEEPDRRKGLEARISEATLRQWDDTANDLVLALDKHGAGDIELGLPKPVLNR